MKEKNPGRENKKKEKKGLGFRLPPGGEVNLLHNFPKSNALNIEKTG
jgi:hypothetical protein